MGGADREELEAAIAAFQDRGDLTSAASALVNGYGAELFSFLCATLRTEDQASDAYQGFCEEMWKALPRFRGESTYRTWAYAVARHSANRIIRDPRSRSDRNVGLSVVPEVLVVAEQIRTTTLLHLRSEVKDRVALLRERLEDDERALLLLRVNRGMTWPEIARILPESEDEDAPDNAAIRKRAAALRQRFQRTKARLKELIETDSQIPKRNKSE